MKKLAVVLLFLLLFTLVISSQDSEKKFDFRKASWGMTKEEVASAEGLELVPWVVGLYKLDSIENILGLQAIVFYSFYQGKLAYAGYEFNDNSNSVYDALGEKLKQKYGEPEYFDERIWLESRNYADNFYHQCALGKMRWESKWTLEKTVIYLRQEANGEGGIRLRLYYLSAEYEKSLASSESDQDKL